MRTSLTHEELDQFLADNSTKCNDPIQKSNYWMCNFCNKSCINISDVKKHIEAKHETECGPFKCEQCPQAFGIKSKLKSHIEIVHRRVKCDICDQEICNKLLLKRHKAKVHGIKPANVHQCEYCPLFFSIKAFLAKHLAKKHPESLDNKDEKWDFQKVKNGQNY